VPAQARYAQIMLESFCSQWMAALALLLVPMLLMEAYCWSRAEPQPAVGPLTTTTGTLSFTTGNYYVHGRTGALQLQCPSGGGGEGSTRRRWCFTDRAWLMLGKVVTVRHEQPVRIVTIPIAVVHEVRTASESLLHDVR
jgi:hypothetical protein